MVKNPPAVQETQEAQVRSLGQEDPLEEEMATHSSVLAWRVPRTEEPGGLRSTGHKESDTTERLSSGTFLNCRLSGLPHQMVTSPQPLGLLKLCTHFQPPLLGFVGNPEARGMILEDLCPPGTSLLRCSRGAWGMAGSLPFSDLPLGRWTAHQTWGALHPAF